MLLHFNCRPPPPPLLSSTPCPFSGLTCLHEAGRRPPLFVPLLPSPCSSCCHKPSAGPPAQLLLLSSIPHPRSALSPAPTKLAVAPTDSALTLSTVPTLTSSEAARALAIVRCHTSRRLRARSASSALTRSFSCGWVGGKTDGKGGWEGQSQHGLGSAQPPEPSHTASGRQGGKWMWEGQSPKHGWSSALPLGPWHAGTR